MEVLVIPSVNNTIAAGGSPRNSSRTCRTADPSRVSSPSALSCSIRSASRSAVSPGDPNVRALGVEGVEPDLETSRDPLDQSPIVVGQEALGQVEAGRPATAGEPCDPQSVVGVGVAVFESHAGGGVDQDGHNRSARPLDQDRGVCQAQQHAAGGQQPHADQPQPGPGRQSAGVTEINPNDGCQQTPADDCDGSRRPRTGPGRFIGPPPSRLLSGHPRRNAQVPFEELLHGSPNSRRHGVTVAGLLYVHADATLESESVLSASEPSTTVPPRTISCERGPWTTISNRSVRPARTVGNDSNPTPSAYRWWSSETASWCGWTTVKPIGRDPPEGMVGQWRCTVPESDASVAKSIDPDGLMRYFERFADHA